MLKTILYYVGDEEEIAIIETKDTRVAAAVARAAIAEYRQAQKCCGDRVLAAVIAGEVQQVRRALRAAGVEVRA